MSNLGTTEGQAGSVIPNQLSYGARHQRASSSPSLTVRTPVARFRSPLSNGSSPLSSASTPSHASSDSFTRRRHILSSRGALSPDRFIPSSSSGSLYHVDSPPSSASASAPRSRRHTAPGTPIPPPPDSGVAIATALGISGGILAGSVRVLNFQKGHRFYGDGVKLNDNEPVSTDAIMSALAAASVKSTTSEEKARKQADGLKKSLSYVPYRVLDAPALRDDFYTNLLAWSSTTNDLAVGLGHEVYVWKETNQTVLLQERNESPVACVSFAPDGKTLVIGRMDGTITCWIVPLELAAAEYLHSFGLCCIGWHPTQNADARYFEFYVGDEVGELLQFRLPSTLSPGVGYALQLISKTKGHSQQICGIAFNPFGNQMAVGANDNTCTIWDIGANGPAASPRYRWDHRAAVKALAYCPWTPSLLATGGGSNDRTIRFWHANSGSLLKSFNTNAQVTSLIWSRSSKELAATFGYANPEHPIRMAIYSYPDCRPIVQIPWQEDIRCLYAVQSAGGGKVCAASSDETVRFYELWDEKSQSRVSHWDNGIFGSDIIELCEGIEKDTLDVIR